MHVFITGGTGLIGTRLIGRLSDRKDRVTLLSRNAASARAKFGSACEVVEGDPVQPGKWMDSIRDCDAVINLAGEGIFNHRWSTAFKAVLRDSRVKTTEHVVQALKQAPLTAAGNSKILVNASAIGYYGPHDDEEIDETCAAGNDSLAQLCIDWEDATRAAPVCGIRTAIVRVGVVLDKGGGALKQMLTPFKLFAGGPVGSGKQWVSWIHHADMVGLLLAALDHAGASGPINGVAPNPVTNKQLAKAIGRALHRPSFMPTPGFALRIVLGEVANVVTAGQRVLPRKAEALGYKFQFPTIDAALADVLK